MDGLRMFERYCLRLHTASYVGYVYSHVCSLKMGYPDIFWFIISFTNYIAVLRLFTIFRQTKIPQLPVIYIYISHHMPSQIIMISSFLLVNFPCITTTSHQITIKSPQIPYVSH